MHTTSACHIHTYGLLAVVLVAQGSYRRQTATPSEMRSCSQRPEVKAPPVGMPVPHPMGTDGGGSPPAPLGRPRWVLPTGETGTECAVKLRGRDEMCRTEQIA